MKKNSRGLGDRAKKHTTKREFFFAAGLRSRIRSSAGLFLCKIQNLVRKLLTSVKVRLAVSQSAFLDREGCWFRIIARETGKQLTGCITDHKLLLWFCLHRDSLGITAYRLRVKSMNGWPSFSFRRGGREDHSISKTKRL